MHLLLCPSPGKGQVLFTTGEPDTPVQFCGEGHYHPVDLKAKLVIDSLQKTGVDTLLFYRHWLGTNGFNGYGKILWMENGVEKQE